MAQAIFYAEAKCRKKTIKVLSAGVFDFGGNRQFAKQDFVVKDMGRHL